MNRILKRIVAKHGIENRDKALLFIDGHIFDYANHPTMIRRYLLKHKNKLLQLVKDYYQQYPKYNPNISAHYQSTLKADLKYVKENLTLPPGINMAMGEFAQDRYAPDFMSYGIGHITTTNQGPNIYISMLSLRNITGNEMIELLKNHYPNCIIYDDDVKPYHLLYASPERKDLNNHKRKFELQFVLSLIYEIDINHEQLRNNIIKQFENFKNIDGIINYKIRFNDNMTDIIIEFTTPDLDLERDDVCKLYEEKIKEYLQNVNIPNIEIGTYIDSATLNQTV